MLLNPIKHISLKLARHQNEKEILLFCKPERWKVKIRPGKSTKQNVWFTSNTHQKFSSKENSYCPFIRNSSLFHRFTTKIYQQIRNFFTVKEENSIDSQILNEKRNIKCCILGAENRACQFLALQLKDLSLISDLTLYSDHQNLVQGLTKQLNQIDMGDCNITGYECDYKNLLEALKDSDIVLMLNGYTDLTAGKREQFRATIPRLAQFTTACLNSCPKAIIVDFIDPITCTLPFISEIFYKNHSYYPEKLIGSCSFAQCRLNTIVADYCNQDIDVTQVPILGGPDEDTIVPVLTQISNNSFSLDMRYEELCNELIMSANKLLINLMEMGLLQNYCSFLYAYSCYVLARDIIKTMSGLLQPKLTCFVRSNIVPKASYIASEVKFGPDGITYHYGLPRLSKLESRLLQKSIAKIDEDMQFAHDELNYYLERMCRKNNTSNFGN